MGIQNKFVAVSKNKDQLELFQQYLDELFQRKYLGSDYKWRIRGEYSGNLVPYRDCYALEGVLWSCSQYELEHWAWFDKKEKEFTEIKFFISIPYEDFVEGSAIIADEYTRVINLVSGELYEGSEQFLSDMPIDKIAEYFGVTLDE